MIFWEVFWQVVLVVGLVCFAGMSVVVGMGGFADIRSMLREIKERGDASIPDDPPGRED